MCSYSGQYIYVKHWSQYCSSGCTTHILSFLSTLQPSGPVINFTTYSKALIPPISELDISTGSHPSQMWFRFFFLHQHILTCMANPLALQQLALTMFPLSYPSPTSQSPPPNNFSAISNQLVFLFSLFWQMVFNSKTWNTNSLSFHRCYLTYWAFRALSTYFRYAISAKFFSPKLQYPLIWKFPHQWPFSTTTCF